MSNPSDKIKCPICLGKGSLKERAKDLKSGNEKDRNKPCKRCKGTGYIDKQNRYKPR